MKGLICGGIFPPFHLQELRYGLSGLRWRIIQGAVHQSDKTPD